MSVSGISSSSLFNTSGVQSLFQQFQQTFQQLGKDLHQGNLSAAQSDFATLQNISSARNFDRHIAERWSHRPDLQREHCAKMYNPAIFPPRNRTSPQIQQDFQNQSHTKARLQSAQGHHHHHGGGGSSEISQLLNQLGTASAIRQIFSYGATGLHLIGPTIPAIFAEHRNGQPVWNCKRY